ncbi:hypothetical protein ISF_01259 [Cordyceps fumosorosea ARSEF 2679]|uniref:Uncharacterized protein n=1 Tax=Cordyceps fumosorosea (strain ARSEF 2679) TaxID=1081104 RepID=A0A168D5C1_CORFA|nr:hypothetical protein ISF_01259 [Cordyceps fumosorosea ARSEF 2679]OAA72186.1 hypothetical protein ISF_01259 [Cordyceps fumosorosea ARSEF 2679]
MIFPKLALVATVLVSGIAASPYHTKSVDKRGQNVIIGYRTVAKEQAQDYMAKKTLTLTRPANGQQIGDGVYTSPEPGEWPIHGSNPWYCAIFADAEALASTAKVWVPRETWWKSSAIDGFISGQGLNPAKTMRMALVYNEEHLQQMLIPKALLNSEGGGLGISVLCKEKLEELPRARVDYESREWKNAKGEVQKPVKAAEEGAVEEGAAEEGAAEGAVEEGAAVEEGVAGNAIGDADLQAALKAGEVGEYRFYAAALEGAGAAATAAEEEAVIAGADATAVEVAAEEAAADLALAEAGESAITGVVLLEEILIV